MNARQWLPLAGSLGAALLVLVSSATKGETQVPACGNWTLTTSTSQSRVGPGAAWDPVNHRVLRFGGYDGTNFLNDLWSYTLAGGWSQLTPAGTPPSPRDAPGFLYDPVRSRMLVICGNAGTPPNDVWELSLSGTPTWTPIVTAGTPPTGRFGFSTIYDPVRDRVILFGGYPHTNEVWELALAGTPTWTMLTPSGTAPRARYGHVAIYDPVRDRMVVHGGTAAGLALADAWALSLSGTPAWSPIPTFGDIPAVYFSAAAYDPIRDRMIVVSGLSDGGNTNSTWSLSLKYQPFWSRIPTGGGPLPAPGRYYHGAVYEPDDDLLLTFNGVGLPGTPSGTTYFTDTWRLDCAGGYWLETAADHGIVNENPRKACYAAASQVSLAATPSSGYSFANWNGDASGTANPITATMDGNKSIIASFATNLLTTQVLPSGSGTVARNPNMPSYPPGTQVTLTASGINGYVFLNWSGDASGTTNPLTVTMDAAKNITANFSNYAVNVTTIPDLSGTVTKSPDQPVYPPGAQVTLTAGGGFPFLGWGGDATGNTNPLTITVNGTMNITASFQAYTLTTTVAPFGTGSVTPNPHQPRYPPGATVQLTATPTQRFTGWTGDASGTDNPLQVTISGNTTVTANFGLTPPACGDWAALAFGTSPSARIGASEVWDPARHRFLMFGGYDGNNLNDVWEFTPSGNYWAQLTPGGSPPSGRTFAGLVYDPSLDRLIVIGGKNGPTPLNDVWALSLATLTWTSLSPAGTPPLAREGMSVVYDSQRNRALLFGGCCDYSNDTWELSLGASPTWTQLYTSGLPPGREEHVAIYDPVRDRMIIHGGLTYTGTATTTLSDTWALSLGGVKAWKQLSATASAPHFYDSAALYDPVRDRMLVSGGREYPSSLPHQDLYALSLKFEHEQVWRKMPVQASQMGERYVHVMAYDPDDDALFVSGGYNAQGQIRGDTQLMVCTGGWWLDGGAENGSWAASPDRGCYPSGTAVSLVPTSVAPYQFHLWYGDASGTTQPLDLVMNSNQTILAQFTNGPVGVDDTPLDFALDEIHPNPNRGPVEVSYALPRSARVKLAIYDLSGREVSLLANGTVEAGRHTARWNGLVSGSAAKSGIYFVRYETPVHTWNKRLVLLR